MKLEQAQSIASSLIALLAPACDLIAVAGSVRRLKPEVKDLEIVIVPVLSTVSGLGFDLFGVTPELPTFQPEFLDRALAEMQDSRVLEYDQRVKRNGTKYKRFIVQPDSPNAIALDLFIAETGNFGNIYALRTGNSEFSKALVTPRRAGGLMPGHLVQQYGYLWHGGECIDCPTEEAFFTALDIRWIEPQFRDANIVPELIL